MVEKKTTYKKNSLLDAAGCPCTKVRWICSACCTLFIICLIFALPVWNFQIEGAVENSSLESSVSVVTVTTKKSILKKRENNNQKNQDILSRDTIKEHKEIQQDNEFEDSLPSEENAAISENISDEAVLSDAQKKGIASYKSYALGRIASKKTYPFSARSQGQQGKVRARIVINPDGTLKSAELLEKCEYEELNQACLDAIKKSAPFKKMTAAFTPLTITFVMDFYLS